MEQHSITWRGIALAITFTPEKFGLVDHIEIMAEGRASLPVTETGYRSHFIPAGTVSEQGGGWHLSPHGWSMKPRAPDGAARSYQCSSIGKILRLALGASRRMYIV